MHKFDVGEHELVVHLHDELLRRLARGLSQIDREAAQYQLKLRGDEPWETEAILNRARRVAS